MTTKQSHPTTADAIAAISRRLTAARAVVSVTAQALDHGESDLEIHAADALKPAAEALDEILSEMLGLRLEAEPPPGQDAPAQVIRAAIDAIYTIHRDSETGSEEDRLLWKAAGNLEEALSAMGATEAGAPGPGGDRPEERHGGAEVSP